MKKVVVLLLAAMLLAVLCTGCVGGRAGSDAPKGASAGASFSQLAESSGGPSSAGSAESSGGASSAEPTSASSSAESASGASSDSATSSAGATAATGSSSAAAAEAVPVAANGTLVVYFSHTGTTKEVAELVHGIVGGDIVELEPVEPYPAGYDAALDPAKQEQRENARPALATTVDDFDSYSTIYLGYPIWWGTTPMLINTFLESYDFDGKTVVPFATSGGTGIGQSVADIRSEVPGANVLDGFLANDPGDVAPWLESLGLGN